MSLFGYWRVLRVKYDFTPASRMTRLTTIARTGRLMNKSVIFIGSGIGRLRVELVPGLHGVVDVDRRAGAEAEGAVGDDLIARLDAAFNGHLVAAGRAELHEALLEHLLRFAFQLAIGDDVDGVAVRRVGDGRGRQREDL